MHQEDGKRVGYFGYVARMIGLKTFNNDIRSPSKKWLDRRKKIFVWSDENFFTVETVLNYQNGKVYATSPRTISESFITNFK